MSPRTWSTAERPRCSCHSTTTDGWVLTSPGHWRAVFGHYSETLAPPSQIPYQVQCLAALLAKTEKTLREVTLAVSPRTLRDVRGTAPSRP